MGSYGSSDIFVSNWVVVISMLGVTHNLWELNVKLGFSHLDMKEFQIISRVDIIFSLPIRHEPSKSHLKGFTKSLLINLIID